MWKHSYMEVTPLTCTSDMYYFSNHYRPCTDINSGWCNVPHKSRLKPTEMMIVAYHNKRVVYAYRGKFNRNIDSDWTGGIPWITTSVRTIVPEIMEFVQHLVVMLIEITDFLGLPLIKSLLTTTIAIAIHSKLTLTILWIVAGMTVTCQLPFLLQDKKLK